jgi:hypothetical protein
VRFLNCFQVVFSLALASIAFISTSRADILIDFDSLSAMPNSPLTNVPTASQLSNQLHSITGAVFSSSLGYVAVADHTEGLGGSAPTLPNVIGGVDLLGRLDYSTDIQISFFDPQDISRPFVTNFVSILGDTTLQFGATATLKAFDHNGSLLGSVTRSESNGPITLSLNATNIHRVVISQNSSNGIYAGTIGFDNLSFKELTAVPEPTSVSLLFLSTVFFVRFHRNRRF